MAIITIAYFSVLILINVPANIWILTKQANIDLRSWEKQHAQYYLDNFQTIIRRKWHKWCSEFRVPGTIVYLNIILRFCKEIDFWQKVRSSLNSSIRIVCSSFHLSYTTRSVVFEMISYWLCMQKMIIFHCMICSFKVSSRIQIHKSIAKIVILSKYSRLTIPLVCEFY